MRGLASNVIFLNHGFLEQGELDEDLGAMNRSVSKVNEEEAALAVQTVRFLLLHSYKPEQIVVLTPYLGQLKVSAKGVKIHANPAHLVAATQTHILL